MASGTQGTWRRAQAPVVAALAVLALLAMAPAGVAADAAAPAGWRSVAYGPATVAVPATWAVRDLGADPGACARADVPALYLGHQGAAASCPAQALGRADTVHVEPLDAATQRFSVLATRPATVQGMPARVNPDPAVGRTLIAAIDDAGLLVRVTYAGDADLPARVLATLRFTNVTPSPAGRVHHAPAMPQASPHATPSGYAGYGFDTCSAPSVDAMRAWAGPSPYKGAGIYVGGTNAACLGGNLNASWVDTVTAMGWHLIPIYVGLQAPCANQSGLAGIDPAQPDAQGVQNADDAVNDM
jgi:hypothetical protein